MGPESEKNLALLKTLNDELAKLAANMQYLFSLAEKRTEILANEVIEKARRP